MPLADFGDYEGIPLQKLKLWKNELEARGSDELAEMGKNDPLEMEL